MATISELHEAYRALLLRICATGYRHEGTEVNIYKVWNKFCQATIEANEQVIEGKMTPEKLKASLQTFDLCCSAIDIIQDEIKRLSETE